MKTKTLLREDFRRIVGIDEDLAGLKDPNNNPRIPGGYGKVLYDSKGNSIGSEGSAGGGGGGGSGSGKDDGGGDGGGEDETAEVHNGGDRITPGSKVSGVDELVDCETGKPVVVRIVGPEPDCREMWAIEWNTQKTVDGVWQGIDKKWVTTYNSKEEAYIVFNKHSSKVNWDYNCIRTDHSPGNRSYLCATTPYQTKEKDSGYYFDPISRCFKPICPSTDEKECKRKIELCDKDGNRVSFDVFGDSIDINQSKFNQISNVNSNNGNVNYIRKT